MTTLVDIANRSLVMIGLQKKISSLTQDSAEAQTINAIITPIENWCFGLANWNFARRSSTLSNLKGPPPSNPSTWSTTYPSPPWLYEFSLPTDFIRALYITNSDPSTANPGYLGEPKRFVIANDTISAVEQIVLLTNQSAPVLVYTAFITDPTIWPWYFERLAVIALAQGISMSLVPNLNLLEELTQTLEQQISIASQINMIEGLQIPDTTPEWIQALGINYPYRRVDGKVDSQQLLAGPAARPRNPRGPQ